MSKIAVVYWSGTGNTEKMADAVAEGVRIEQRSKQLVMIYCSIFICNKP